MILYPRYLHSGPDFKVHTVEDVCGLDSILKLRNEVYSEPEIEYTKSLWVHNGREIDEWDDCSVCLACKKNSEVVGAARVTKNIHGMPCAVSYGRENIDRLVGKGIVAEVTRLIAKREARGNGISCTLMYHLITYGKKAGIETYLMTLANAHVPFYLQLNAEVVFKKVNRTFNKKLAFMKLDLENAKLEVLKNYLGGRV